MNTCLGSLTIFFPMWNEEEMILRTVGTATETGDDLLECGAISDYEVLIVDDASTDATGKIADELAATDARIRVLHHATNRGLGGSVRTGLAEATTDLVLYTDADMPFDLADLGKAIRLMRVYDADIVAAYRFDRTGEGAKRSAYSHVYNTLVKTLFRLRIRDVNFAFKLVRRDVLDASRAAERGFVHRRRVAREGAATRLLHHPVRRRLLPARARHLDAVAADGHRGHPA